MKNLIRIDDINKDIIFNIIDTSDKNLIFYPRPKPVLGLLFLDESTRTSNSLKSAIIRLGGGWLGFEGLKATYISSGMDTIENSLISLSSYCDILAVRGNIPYEILDQSNIPVINAGNDFIITPLWGLWLSYILKYYFADRSIKVGVYGLARYSTPIKSYYSILSYFKYEFYEDSIITEAQSQNEIVTTIRKNGSSYQNLPINDFIRYVDVLIVADINPEVNYNRDIFSKFLKNYKSISFKIISQMPNRSKIFIVEPFLFKTRQISTIDSEVFKNVRVINKLFNQMSVKCNMGLFHFLIDEDI